MKKLLIALLFLIPFEAHAVIYVAGTASSSNGGAPAPTMPTNAVNDILIIAYQSSNESVSAPSGYTEIDSQASMATGTAVTLGSLRMAVFWKRSTGSETTPTLPDTGDHNHALVIVIRGVVTTGNPWDVETCGVQATTSTSVSWQSSGMAYGSNGSTMTTTVNGALVLGLIAHAVDVNAVQLTAEAATTLNNVTEIADNFTNIGTGGGIAAFTGIKPAAGVVVDNVSNNVTATLANTSKYAIFLMALKPANPSAPLYIGQGTGSQSLTGLTPALDFIYGVDDILLLLVQTANQAITAPSGWTEIDANASMGTGTAGAAGSTRLGVFYKRATSSSETAPTISDTGDHQVAQVYGFKNCIATGNPYGAESVGVQATPATSAFWISAGMAYGSNGSTVTTSTDNVLVLTIVANAFDNVVTQTSAFQCAALSNYVEIGDFNTATGTGGGFGIAAGEAAVSGTIIVDTGSNNFSAVLANSTVYAMAVISLKPPLVAGTARQKAAFFQLFP